MPPNRFRPDKAGSGKVWAVESTRTQQRRHRFAALSIAILTCAGLAACLTESVPEQRIPVLPALPLTPVETAQLDPLFDTRPLVAALMRSLPYRNDADWHDWQASALLPFIEADRRSAALPALLDALAGPDLATRQGAAMILARVSEWYWQQGQPERLADALVAAAGDSDARVRENAVQALGAIRPFASVEPPLLAALDDPDPRVRWAAVRSLTWREHSEAVPDRLAGALEDPDARVRIAAAYFHGFGAGESGAVLDGILGRLHGGDRAARQAAAEQLQFFSDGIDHAALPALAGMLDDPEVRMRQLGARTLNGALFSRRHAGAGASAPVPDTPALARSLAAALADNDAEVRTFAAWGLRSLGEAALPVMPELGAALEVETDPQARIAMGQARKAATGDEMAIPADTGTSWTDPALCLGRSDYALGGLRPWDSEQKAWDLLGEPGEITGGWSESDGGAYATYRYRYPDLEVDLAGYGVEMLSTASPTIVVGQHLRIGMSRERVLSEVFGIPSTAEALAARRYMVTDCENPYQEVYFHLEFDRDGLLSRMQMFADQP